MGGAMTMACLSGKDHGKKYILCNKFLVPVKCIIASAVEYSAVQFSSLQQRAVQQNSVHYTKIQCSAVL